MTQKPEKHYVHCTHGTVSDTKKGMSHKMLELSVCRAACRRKDKRFLLCNIYQAKLIELKFKGDGK